MTTADQPGRFARYIRDVRDRRGWTQEHLADESGVGRRTIVRWESGEITVPDVAQLHAAVDALGVPRVRAYVALGWLPEEDAPPEITPSERRVITAIRAIAALDASADVRLRGIVELLDALEEQDEAAAIS